MKIFVVKHFDKFMTKHKISDSDICNLVNQLKEGLIDADLGGGVIKQRIARKNQGKSNGFRSIIIFKMKDLSVFIYGYSKSEQANINKKELKAFKLLAKSIFKYNEVHFGKAVDDKLLREITYE